jgi:hypothetical protein
VDRTRSGLLKVDEDQVDNYILGQKGSEYYVLGAQFAGEEGKRRGR